MINFLHTFSPEPIILNFGFLSLRWYGFLIVLGIIAALYLSFFLGKKYFNIDVHDRNNYDFFLDTSDLNIEEVFAKILNFIKKNISIILLLL